MAAPSVDLPAKPIDPRIDAIIKLAVMAVGGQGGGVLTNWIVALAEANGYAVQATSVAGVAQRTGATIYYVEMAPAGERQPVFALSPAPGDVDILIAAEMMEAGRAMMRGFVTPDRTTLIASSHRAFATAEKIAPGDAIADSGAVREAASARASRFIAFDMERIALDAGTVISASLFGALAGASVLPFPRESFEATIRASGRGVEPSLAAFAVAHDRAAGGGAPSASEDISAPGPAPRTQGPVDPGWTALLTRLETLPEPVAAMGRIGLAKVVDFQDLDYGSEYLDYLDEVLAADRAHGGEAHQFRLSVEAAKYVANAMAYDDVIRVADLKTRRSRLERVAREIGVEETSILHLTEFMHPRAEEVTAMLPVRAGRYVQSSPRLFAVLDRLVNRGRRVRTDSILWFGMLYAVAGLRSRRRRLLRHAIESAHLRAWLDTAVGHARTDYDLAVEIFKCRRLIKGYSDTHARGLSKFDRVMSGVALVAGREDAAEWVHRLRTAALADVTGETLDGALATVRSFAGSPAS